MLAKDLIKFLEKAVEDNQSHVDIIGELDVIIPSFSFQVPGKITFLGYTREICYYHECDGSLVLDYEGTSCEDKIQ